MNEYTTPDSNTVLSDSSDSGKKNFICLLLLGLAAYFVFIIAGFLLFFQISVKPVTQKVLYFEAGYRNDVKLQNVLTGPKWFVDKSTLETALNTDVIGEYEVVVKHGISTYYFTAVVQDTEAPELKLVDAPVYVEVIEGNVSIDALVESVSDKGSNVSTYFKYSDKAVEQEEDVLSFSKTGKYSITVCAEDEYDNITERTIIVTADTAPVIEGIRTYYVVPGSKIDILDGILAKDDVDGVVGIEYSPNDYDLSLPGEYNVKLTATDSYGLSSDANVLVVVASADDIQEKINNHEISATTEYIIGAYNIYDRGYSIYSDIEDTLSFYQNAFVAITEGSRESGCSRGSGYIVKITDDEIRIVTNNHVAYSESKQFYVEFYDETRAKATLVARSKKTCSKDDIAILSVKISDVPSKVFDTLYTVHIDQSNYSKAPENSTLDVGMKVWKDSLNLRPTKVSTGKLVSKLADSLSTAGSAMQVTVPLYTGCSGSAVIDKNGNLIGMTTFTVGGGTRTYWCVPFDRILVFYRNTYGEALNYK